MLHRRISARAAFSLVEMVVASFILAILAIATIGGLQFAARTSRINTNSIVAKNIAQGFLEQMLLDDFSDVGAARYPTIPVDRDPPVWLDRALGVRCRVEFAFKGFGQLENSSKSALTDAKAHWEPNEWQGDIVFLVEGPGAGQMATVASNTPNTLHLAAPLDYAPHQNTRYMINNGKTVEVTTSWSYRGREYRQTVEALVVNSRNTGTLGF